MAWSFYRINRDVDGDGRFKRLDTGVNMIDIELPMGKRKLSYRLFELLPAFLSYGALLLLVILSLINPTIAAIYLMLVIITLLVKAIGIAFRTLQGHKMLERAERINWNKRLEDLEDPTAALEKRLKEGTDGFGSKVHIDNLRNMSANPDAFPKPSQVYNAVIIATWNESYEILSGTIKRILSSTHDKKRIILTIAYEERGGDKQREIVEKLQKEFSYKFYAFYMVEHPDGLPNDVIGKGANLTYAAKYLSKRLKEEGIKSKDVIVTTLDADNKPHKLYFDYLTYEFIVHENRKHLAFQPVCLFFSNIWDVPAPMRVVATGNSFWNIISSMRPHTLRNFASHSQPLEALEGMNFWSTRTIVEDGHQYWRSYFYFGGNYAVVPIYVPIYQDAVLSDTFFRTLKAQFIQLQRWAYGASDVPYVAVRLFSKDRNVPFISGVSKFVRLVDGHVTLASVSILVAVGGWVPLLINGEAARSVSAHQLPDIVSSIQQFALLGLLITVFLSFKMLPPRPQRYKRTRSFFMLAQWILMPITAIVYSSMAALSAQTKLFLGRYMNRFAVTDKATHSSIAIAKEARKKQALAK